VYSENGLLVDLAEVEKVVDLCDVFTIIFRLFPERLLVDSRTSSQEGPLVALVEPVATVEERYHWLGRKRPSFGPPESFMFFLWPHSIALLEECGVVARIRRRCEAGEWPVRLADSASADGGDAVSMFDRAMAVLREREVQATRAAIIGEDYRTIWPSERRSLREG
jgi:hypothetical protein